MSKKEKDTMMMLARCLAAIVFFVLAGVFTTKCSAQNEEKMHSIDLFTAPGAVQKADNSWSSNFGFRWTWEAADWNLLGFELYHHPELNEYAYTHLAFRFHLEHEFHVFDDYDKDLQLSAGPILGTIHRETADRLQWLIGLEAQIRYTIPGTNIYVFVLWSNQTATDQKTFDPEFDSINRNNNIFVGFGYRF